MGRLLVILGIAITGGGAFLMLKESQKPKTQPKADNAIEPPVGVADTPK